MSIRAVLFPQSAFLRLVLLLFAAACFAFIAGSRASGQTARPEFFVTWRASSYAPPDYSGKVLPTNGSEITVSSELIENGKILDLAGERVLWYLDDNVIGRGEALRSVSFIASARAGGRHEVRVQINSFRKQSDIVSKTIDIPVARPEAVIETRLPSDAFQGTNVRVRGKPYFFNVGDVSELEYKWVVNGKSPTDEESPSFLDINLVGSQAMTELRVGLTVVNPKDVLEFARAHKSVSLGKP